MKNRERMMEEARSALERHNLANGRPARPKSAESLIKYAGIGSRETPESILNIMRASGSHFASRGLVLRSGGAEGADRAFELGCDSVRGMKNIFYAKDATPQAVEMASRFHPNWNACSDFARKLHGRNCMQILGPELNDPVKFVVCWTKDGGPTGGTGMAIRVAQANNIPVFNLHEVWVRCKFSYETGLWIPDQVNLSRCQKRLQNTHPNAIDTTFQSGEGYGQFFAPTKEMVLGFKKKDGYEEVSEDEYRLQYKDILSKVSQKVIWEMWMNAQEHKELCFVCYCRDEWFCHTYLMIEHLTTKYPYLFKSDVVAKDGYWKNNKQMTLEY